MIGGYRRILKEWESARSFSSSMIFASACQLPSFCMQRLDECVDSKYSASLAGHHFWTSHPKKNRQEGGPGWTRIKSSWDLLGTVKGTPKVHPGLEVIKGY